MLHIPQAQHSQLLLIDCQPALAKAIPRWQDKAEQATHQLLAAQELFELPLTVTEQMPAKLGHTHADLLAGMTSRVVEKCHFNACEEEGFVDALRATERKQVVVAGMEAHICVLLTSLGLLAAGFEVFIAADAVSSRCEDNRTAALDQLRAAGATVLPVETLLFAWTTRADGAVFRRVLPWVR